MPLTGVINYVCIYTAVITVVCFIFAVLLVLLSISLHVISKIVILEKLRFIRTEKGLKGPYLEQENLANSKVSARQQCVYEGP